jgi:hypothetical protein
MKIEIRNRCSDFNSYRAARVKSLFNAESGCNFDLDAELDLSGDWSIGVVVGPSGSGKTSIGRQIFGDPAPFGGDYRQGGRRRRRLRWPYASSPRLSILRPARPRGRQSH